MSKISPAPKRRAWVEGDPPPDAAHGPIVQTAHVEGITYQRKFITCGKCSRCKAAPAHGPYWYAVFRSKGATKSKYVGKKLPRIDQLADRPEMA